MRATPLAQNITFILFSLMRRPDAAATGLFNAAFLAGRSEEKPLLSAWKNRILALEFAGLPVTACAQEPKAPGS